MHRRCLTALLALSLIGATIGHAQIARADSTLQTVKDRGTLLAGVRFDTPPYGFVDAAGKNVGVDVEIAAEIARRLGVKLELVRVTGQSRIPTLTSGKVDALIAALTVTPEREKVIDYTMIYVTDGSSVVVKAGSPIKTIADLNDRTVSFVQGTTADEGLRLKAPNAKVLKFQDYPSAFLAFRQGLADAFIGETLGIGQFLNTDPGKYDALPEVLHPDPIGIGLRKDDTEWKAYLNEQLKAIIRDGTWSAIMAKYVGTAVEIPKLDQ